MKPFLKRILMVVIDAVSMILICYFSYFLIKLIGRESSDIFINNKFIFAAVKLAVYAVFFMYSLNEDRSYLLDVAGIIVANAAADALAYFLFDLPVTDNILLLAILLAWDLVIGLMVRFLMRNPGEDDEDDDENNYFLNQDDDEYLTATDAAKVFDDDAELAAGPAETAGASAEGALLPETKESTEKEFSSGVSDELNAKIDAMLKMIEDKDSKIDMLENKLALQSSMDFENYAPEGENDAAAVADSGKTPQKAEQAPPAADSDELEDSMQAFYGYTQPFNQPYVSQPQYPQQKYVQNAPLYAPPYMQQESIAERNKREIIDSILTDIKNLYSTLTAKTKELDEREKELLLKTIELEQKEKTLDKLQQDTRTAAADIVRQTSKVKKQAVRTADEMYLPRDNIGIADNILKTLEALNKTSAPPFVLAQAPEGEVNTPAAVKSAAGKPVAAAGYAFADTPRRSPENAALTDVDAGKNKKPVDQAEAQAARQAQARAAAAQQAKAAAQKKRQAIEAQKAKAAEEKRKEELARIQQERLKSAIKPQPKAPAAKPASAVKEKNEGRVDFSELGSDKLNLNEEDLDSISSFLDNL